MSQPVKQSVYIDKALTNISIAYKNANYIWNEVFPVVRVDKESGKYWVFTQGDWFRDEAVIRAPGDEAPKSGFTLSTSSYNCVEYALATDIPDRTLDNADAALRLRVSKTEFVTDKTQLRMERQLASEIFTTGVWGTDTTPTNLWDTSTGTPIEDVMTAIDTIALATGVEPNTLILGREVWKALKTHADIKDVIKYTQKAIPTPDLLAQIWDLDRVLIGRAIYNSADEGATPSYAAIWGKHALVCHVAPNPGLMTPSAGYTFVARPFRVRRWRDDAKEAEIIEASIIADFVITGSGLGYFFSNVVS